MSRPRIAVGYDGGLTPSPARSLITIARPEEHHALAPAESATRDPSDGFGEVQCRAGRQVVVFRRRLGHAPARVWAAIAEPAERAEWVPGIRFEPVPNGPFDIWFGDQCEGPAHASGRIAVFEPPSALQLGSMRFELTPIAEGCLLEFSDGLRFDDSRSRFDFANAVLAGWHRFLDTLEVWLDEGVSALDLPEPDYSAIDVPGRDRL